jgi:hypothetical protein
MSVRKWITIVIVWIASLALAGIIGRAQSPNQTPSVQPQTPTIISGNDLGFRVEGRKGNTPVGALVVRINGQWVDAEFGVGIKRLTAK